MHVVGHEGSGFEVVIAKRNMGMQLAQSDHRLGIAEPHGRPCHALDRRSSQLRAASASLPVDQIT